MKLVSSLAIAVLSVAVALSSLNAEAAKRMGSGRSIGQQSQNVTQRQAMQPHVAPNNTVQNQTAPAKPATLTPATPAPAAPKPWGAMLGGLAAGLGLAWLANSMGFGGALSGFIGNMLMLLLMGFAVMLAWSAYKRYKMRDQESHLQPIYSKGYSLNNVGNDSAARPFERTVFADTPPVTNQGGSMIGSALGTAHTDTASALSGAQNWGIPAGFDTVGFLAGAKAHFVNLQAAWDKGDVATLQTMLTPEMMTEIRTEIAQRDATAPTGTVHHTEVVSVEALLLGIEEMPAGIHAAQYMASVEFSGVIREEAGLAPAPFREVWNLTKPVAGGGWMVAGIQALD